MITLEAGGRQTNSSYVGDISPAIQSGGNHAPIRPVAYTKLTVVKFCVQTLGGSSPLEN